MTLSTGSATGEIDEAEFERRVALALKAESAIEELERAEAEDHGRTAARER